MCGREEKEYFDKQWASNYHMTYWVTCFHDINCIRQMTDEELAELYEEYADCRMCIYSPHNCKSECVDGYTKWLKQESQEDE